MDNQHQKIKGYRDLSHAEITLMNEIKAHGQTTEALLAKVQEHINAQFDATNAPAAEGNPFVVVDTKPTPEQTAERQRLLDAMPGRWKAIAATDFQTGFMALVRAVAQPTTF